jgi:hypothetical protein
VSSDSPPLPRVFPRVLTPCRPHPRSPLPSPLAPPPPPSARWAFQHDSKPSSVCGSQVWPHPRSDRPLGRTENAAYGTDTEAKDEKPYALVFQVRVTVVF